MLEVQHDRTWYDIVALDESWLYLSTDYKFVWLRRNEKFPKENDTEFNRKSHARDRLESARVPFDQVLEKVASSTPAIISLRHQSHCPNGTQLKQRATSENCWCMRTMRTRIPPYYQLNILTGIE
jgi:hypothetical protein